MKILIIPTLLSGFMFVLAVSCGSSSSSTTPAPAAASALSASFTSTCGACHGSAGGGGSGTKLSGTALTLAQFKATVRSGKGGDMSAYSTSSYSDANLEADYAILSK